MKHNGSVFLKVIQAIMMNGNESSPRGQKILEIEDAKFSIDPRYPAMNFEDRKLNIDYFKKEWLWKLSADRYNDKITEHASTWSGIKDVDGGYNSNYGQYFFGPQGFDWVIRELIRDKDSRRAVIVLLDKGHIRTNNPDHVCTYSVSFRIRDNMLNMSVNMRSNDLIWGFTNDALTFCMLYRLVYGYLRTIYTDLRVGGYTHKADSLHIYERHWDMCNKILDGGLPKFENIYIPFPRSHAEVQYIIANGGKIKEPIVGYDLHNWMVS